jgi:hypothetical protein
MHSGLTKVPLLTGPSRQPPFLYHKASNSTLADAEEAILTKIAGSVSVKKIKSQSTPGPKKRLPPKAPDLEMTETEIDRKKRKLAKASAKAPTSSSSKKARETSALQETEFEEQVVMETTGGVRDKLWLDDCIGSIEFILTKHKKSFSDTDQAAQAPSAEGERNETADEHEQAHMTTMVAAVFAIAMEFALTRKTILNGKPLKLWSQASSSNQIRARNDKCNCNCQRPNTNKLFDKFIP